MALHRTRTAPQARLRPRSLGFTDETVAVFAEPLQFDRLVAVEARQGVEFDRLVAVEASGFVSADRLVAVEALGVVEFDRLVAAEALQGLRSDRLVAVEALVGVQFDRLVAVEAAGSTVVAPVVVDVGLRSHITPRVGTRSRINP